jgi:hypothetical protein
MSKGWSSPFVGVRIGERARRPSPDRLSADSRWVFRPFSPVAADQFRTFLNAPRSDSPEQVPVELTDPVKTRTILVG